MPFDSDQDEKEATIQGMPKNAIAKLQVANRLKNAP